ncbi:MAG: TIGR02206 family membrane protein [Planctomycetota bacterium]
MLDPSTWPMDFAMFTRMHLYVVLVSTTFVVGACLLGRRWRDTPRERWFRHAWGVGIIVEQVIHNIWWLQPERFDPGVSFPLHFCDLAAPLAAIVCFAPWRWARALLFYWAIGLSSWAFITPVLTEGPGHELFWMFWLNHVQIVGTAIYELVVRGFRPGWRDLRTGLLGTGIYAGLMLPANLAFDVNYGYLGPGGAGGGTPIDALGPWPWRLVTLALLVGLGMTAMTFGARALPGGRCEKGPASPPAS